MTWVQLTGKYMAIDHGETPQVFRAITHEEHQIMLTAQDLLEACKAMHAARYSSWPRFAEEDEPEPYDMALGTAAIAKAEGGAG